MRWYGVNGAPDWSEGSRHLAYCLFGASQGDRDLYVMINGGTEARVFTMQEKSAGKWLRIVDTALPSPEDIVEDAQAPVVDAATYRVEPRSVVVLLSA